MGENGAGKSTLVKIIYGLMQANAGILRWIGEPIKINGPAAARELGIGMIFQHFSLFESMTVLENIALGINEEINFKKLRFLVDEVSRRYGLTLNADRHVNFLSMGERQKIEIVRCLLQNPKLLILDEPTSVLTPQEASQLFMTIRNLAESGCSILYISHKLTEVMSLCEKATILRDGKLVASCDPKKETTQTLAEMMLGQRPGNTIRPTRNTSSFERLKINGLTTPSSELSGVNLKNITFSVKKGEVLGIAGLAGNGQTELMAALSGETLIKSQSDVICFDGRSIGELGPLARRLLGAAFVPEQRYGHAAVKEMNLKDNAFLTAASTMNLKSKGLISRHITSSFCQKIISKFDVRTTGSDATAANLSGGNLQKFIIGREILQNPGIFVVSQPTWGVDAGAAVTIRQALLDLADAGCAVLIISQDLDEIFEMCDRIAVIAAGELSASFPVGSVSNEEMGLLMGGESGKERY